MLKTAEVFDLIKQKHKIQSDYALAKQLGVSGATICKHRKKSFGMEEPLALKCARLADIRPELLLLWSAAESAKCTESEAVFRRIAAWVEIRESEFRTALPA